MIGVLPYPGGDTVIVKNHEYGDLGIAGEQLRIQKTPGQVLVQLEQSVSTGLETLVVRDPLDAVMYQPDLQIGFHPFIRGAGTGLPEHPGLQVPLNRCLCSTSTTGFPTFPRVQAPREPIDWIITCPRFQETNCQSRFLCYSLSSCSHRRAIRWNDSSTWRETPGGVQPSGSELVVPFPF